MRFQKSVTLFAVLMIGSLAMAKGHTITKKQADNLGKLIETVKMPAGWKLDAIEIQKDHAVIKLLSPKNLKMQIGLFHPADIKDAVLKTQKFALKPMPGSDGGMVKPVMDALAAALRAGESGFEWENSLSPVTGMQSDSKMLKLLLKARKLHAYGEKKQALTLVNQVVNKAQTPGMIAQAGRYLADFGMKKQAAEVLQKAENKINEKLRQNPRDVHVLSEAVSVYALLGRPKKAIDMYWKLVALHPEPVEGKDCLASRVGAALTEAKKDDLVLKFYYKVLKRFPACKNVYLNTMFLESKNQSFDRVDDLAKQALKRWPNDQDVLFTWGNLYHTSGKFKRSSSIFLRLAAINPRYPTLLSLLGSSLINLGKSDERLEEVKRQVKLHPKNLGWYYGLGAIYFYRKEYKKALPYLKRTAELAPDEARPKIYLALTEYWLGHKKEARDLLESINHLAYEDPDVFFCQAIVWSDVDKKRSLEAMQKFVNILDNEPSRVQWGNKRARAHKILEELKQGKISESLLDGKPDTEAQQENSKRITWIIGGILLLVFGVWGYLLFRPSTKKDPES